MQIELVVVNTIFKWSFGGQRREDRELSDDRISGIGEFGERMIKKAEAKKPVKVQHQKIDEFMLTD